MTEECIPVSDSEELNMLSTRNPSFEIDVQKTKRNNNQKRIYRDSQACLVTPKFFHREKKSNS